MIKCVTYKPKVKLRVACERIAVYGVIVGECVCVCGGGGGVLGAETYNITSHMKSVF